MYRGCNKTVNEALCPSSIVMRVKAETNQPQMTNALWNVEHRRERYILLLLRTNTSAYTRKRHYTSTATVQLISIGTESNDALYIIIVTSKHFERAAGSRTQLPTASTIRTHRQFICRAAGIGIAHHSHWSLVQPNSTHTP